MTRPRFSRHSIVLPMSRFYSMKLNNTFGKVRPTFSWNCCGVIRIYVSNSSNSMHKSNSNNKTSKTQHQQRRRPPLRRKVVKNNHAPDSPPSHPSNVKISQSGIHATNPNSPSPSSSPYGMHRSTLSCPPSTVVLSILIRPFRKKLHMHYFRWIKLPL